MPQFYLLWIQLFVNVIGGVTLISNAVFILADLTKVSAAAVAPLFGLVSIFNALGRGLWGAISDRIGCNHTFAAMFAVQAATLFLLGNVHNLTLALAAFSVILLCCGGGFGTMPSFNAEYFGTRFMGLNYGLILSAWGFAGLIGPIVAARARDLTGSFGGTLPLLGAVLTMSVILPFITKKPARTLRAAPSNDPSLGNGPSLALTDPGRWRTRHRQPDRRGRDMPLSVAVNNTGGVEARTARIKTVPLRSPPVGRQVR